MLKKQSTAKGFTVLGAASILNKALSIIYVPFLTLMIGNVGNGIANFGYTIYILIYQITYMGIPVALSKMVSEQVALGHYRDSVRTMKVAAALLFGMGLVLGGAMALFAGPIARIVGSPESAMTLLALSPTVLIASVSAALRGYFQGRRNMTPTSVSQIVEQAANTVFTLAFAWWMLKIGEQHAALHGITNPDMVHLYSLQWGAAGSGLGTTAGAVFSACYLAFFYLRRRRSIREEAEQLDASEREALEQGESASPVLASELARKLLSYAGPIVLGALVVYLAQVVDMSFTIARLKHGGFSDVDAKGLYGILTTQYTKIIGVPLAFANTLAVVMLPNISGTAALRDREALQGKIEGGMKAVFLLTLPSAAMLAALAEPIIRLLFPRDVFGMDLMRIGSWVIVLMAMVQLETSVLQGMGRMRLPVVNMAIGLVVKIVVNYVLIGIHAVNIRGAVAGSVLCYGLASLLNYRKIRGVAGFSVRWRRLVLPPLFASAVMAAAAWGTWYGLDALLKHAIPFVFWRNLASILPALVVGLLIYAVHIVAFHGLTRAEVLKIPFLPRIIGRNRMDRLMDWMRII